MTESSGLPVNDPGGVAADSSSGPENAGDGLQQDTPRTDSVAIGPAEEDRGGDSIGEASQQEAVGLEGDPVVEYLVEWCREIDLQTSDIEKMVLDLRAEVGTSLEELWRVVRVIEDRQAAQMAAAVERRQDIGDHRHVQQTELASRFELFLSQDVISLAGAVLPYVSLRSPRTEWVARLVSDICVALLRQWPPDVIDPLQGLMKAMPAEVREDASKVVSNARELISVARSNGLQFHWDFHFQPGPLNPRWQKPWGPCDPNRRTKFLVTPAYVVDERVYLLQQVYTERTDPEATDPDE